MKDTKFLHKGQIRVYFVMHRSKLVLNVQVSLTQLIGRVHNMQGTEFEPWTLHFSIFK